MNISELDPAPYLAKTYTPFLVGDTQHSMTGCNTLVSLHVQPARDASADEPKRYTYVSHSIKEFFDNVQKVPGKFTNDSAFHLCVDPQIQWLSSNQKVATVHDHPDLFKPHNASGPDALAKEIIANITHDVAGYYMFLGDPISAGYKACLSTRFDWEQDKKIHNLSDACREKYGTAVTKQWLKVNNTDSITKLSMLCKQTLAVYPLEQPHYEDKVDDDAGTTFVSSHLPVQVLFALFVAALAVSCA